MGYETQFEGEFNITPPLSPARLDYLQAFCRTRRMKRNGAVTATLPDPVREAVGLPVGIDGCFFVGAPGFAGQDRTHDIVDYNRKPSGQHGLWCGLAVRAMSIELAEGENYRYDHWLEYVIREFLAPWGHTVNGKVRFRGEDFEDAGVVEIKDNVVTVRRIQWPDEDAAVAMDPRA